LSEPFRITHSERVLDCHVFSVDRVTVATGETTFEREIVRHAGAVAVLAVRDDGAVGLLRQYRATFDDVTWELPAGTRDVDGESPESTAQRELVEELGCRAANLRPLFTFMNSRGWTDQTSAIYLATGLEDVEREPAGPEETASTVHWLNVVELRELLERPDTIDVYVLTAGLWYLAELAR
jgi:ADP-ribose pyrophosphatase